MKNANSYKRKIKKLCITLLAVTLILGVLSSSFGITVLALSSNKKSANSPIHINENATQEDGEEYVSPTEGYEDLNNEITLNDDVVVLTEAESNDINSSIVSIEKVDNYYGDCLEIVLSGEEHSALSDITYDDIIYLQGDFDSPFGGDRILKVERISAYNEQTYLEVSEPYFEEAFDSMEVCSSDILSEENLIDTYYADGVEAHFGSIESEMTGVSKTGDLGDVTAQTLAAEQQVNTTPLGTEYKTDGNDLIITVDYEFTKKDEDKEEKEEEDEDESFSAGGSFGIKGSVGLKNLVAHLVCDMPSVTTIEELYLGVSGEFFLDVDLYGSLEASDDLKSGEKDWAFLKLSGLGEKRFPIAVFQFQGTTPVYITNAAFDKNKEAIIPSLYFILYADWEGNISFTWTGGFEYSYGFNNGLRVFENGTPKLSFEKYPYVRAYDSDDENEFVWSTELKLEANTEITILGSSVLFYVAGINLGEISIARLGVQAECDLSMSADSKDGFKFLETEDNTFYIQGFLRLIEVKVKIKAEGKSFLSKLSIDLNFEFSLINFTLFEKGLKPDKYRPKVPISSMNAPDEFESVMTLVCDVSGSMDSTVNTGQTKLAAAKEAGKAIVSMTENWSKNNDGNFGIGVVQFASSAETVSIPHIDYKYLNECIDCIKDGGGTCIYAGIDNGVSQLEAVNSTNKVIILMTDGNDGATTQTMESAKKAAEKNIKIYTIGFGNDVNESILKEIAQTTGGEYQFANTDNIMSIIGSFMYAQQAANATVLTEQEGTVAEGETSEKSEFSVANMSGNLTVSTAWPGSFLDTILVDPHGRTVDNNYPGASTDESKIPSTIIVNNPIPGKWSVCVKGIETSYENEPYYTIVSFKETKDGKINEAMSTIETIAAYCIPIGIFIALTSTMLLIVVAKKKSE